MRKLAFGLFAAVLCLGVAQQARAEGTGLTQGQVTTAARQLEAAIKQSDVNSVNALFDQNALLDRAVAGVAVPPELMQGLRSGLQRNPPLSREASAIWTNGTYHFLRVRQINGEYRALFRFVNKQNGLNYHDWVAAADSQGQVKFVDQYIGATGEMFSQTLRRTIVLAVAHASPTLLQRLTGSDRDFINNFKTMGQMSLELQRKNYQGALAAYASLPQSMQQDKSVMIQRLFAAERLRDTNPGAYQSVMADFARLFPGDPCLDLVCLDFLIEQNKFQEARDSVKRLETFTGGDPYLGVIRGNIDMLEGGPANLAAARNEFQMATIIEPMLPQAYWALVALDLKNKDYDKVAAELTEIQHKLHIPIGSLEGKPLYAGFVQSDAYRKWKAAQAGNN